MFFRLNAVHALTLCGVLLLAACSSTPTSNEMYRKTPSDTPVVEQKPKEQTEPVLSLQRRAAIESAGLKDRMIPAQLVGLSEHDVRAALDSPQFVRKDKGVEVWQYRHRDCILDLFLYQMEDRGPFRVDHTELRGTSVEKSANLSCFGKIVMGQS